MFTKLTSYILVIKKKNSIANYNFMKALTRLGTCTTMHTISAEKNAGHAHLPPVKNIFRTEKVNSFSRKTFTLWALDDLSSKRSSPEYILNRYKSRIII